LITSPSPCSSGDVPRAIASNLRKYYGVGLVKVNASSERLP
jgi:hypothetical protein